MHLCNLLQKLTHERTLKFTVQIFPNIRLDLFLKFQLQIKKIKSRLVRFKFGFRHVLKTVFIQSCLKFSDNASDLENTFLTYVDLI